MFSFLKKLLILSPRYSLVSDFVLFVLYILKIKSNLSRFWIMFDIFSVSSVSQYILCMFWSALGAIYINKCSSINYNPGHNILRLFNVWQVFLSPQLKRFVIISNKYGIYELHHELPNDLRFKILRNLETSRSQNFIEL